MSGLVGAKAGRWRARLVAFSLAGSMAVSGAVAANDVTAAFSKLQAGSTATVDHSGWERQLQAYVRPAPDGVNRVDYRAWKAQGHKALKDYVARLERVRVGTLDRPEQMAYWINLYNAKTIDVVLDHYPVKSIREIALDQSILGFLKKSVGAGGPWKAPVVNVEGRRLSLDNIEHDILRPIYKDPRVHYAVNCASYGCPNLQAVAFTGATLEAQLDAGAKAYVNHPRGVRVDGGRVVASSIYDWFNSDFGGGASGTLAHMRRYADVPLQGALDGKATIDSYEYDWRLNDVAHATP